MRFLLYNIRYATGQGVRYHLPLPFSGFFRHTANTLNQIVDFIDSVQPDIVALIEVDSGSYRSDRCCQADIIAKKLHQFHIVETKYANNSLARRVPVLNKQSNALLTREKITSHHFHYFNEGFKRLVIEVELADIVVFIVHLSLKYRHRQQQLEHLHRLVKNSTKPMIVAGDFNTFGGDRELELFKAATGLEDANPLHFPSHPSHAPHRQLDFIFHSPELEAVDFRIPDIRLSDHAPLICDFRCR
ncbi:MAG: endonuclease/exonuclease/phosphatase family protein [Desulfobulbaceae bacterium]|jgi:endonuclease/exonuclease/phosphatase family metal-dependent hydrolase|nr:endonuclease/exonuclease/phosphatase family protein [Desulfobulbaceae bacterium]